MEQEDLSPIGLRPKTGDPGPSSTHRLSENARRLGESLTSVTKRQEVTGAKIQSRSHEVTPPEEECWRWTGDPVMQKLPSV